MCVAKIADGHYDNDEECKFKSLLPQLQATKCPSPNPSLANCHGGLTDFWYPDYDTAWSEAGCLNTLPLPFNNPNGRPTYDTHIACCKGAYAGQTSGACFSELESPPTTSPTNPGGLTNFWYPDYDTAWSIAGCKNTLPLPYNNPNDRPNYDTHIACCKGAYAGQVSGACLSELESPPTTSPTNEGNTGSDYYPDYSLPWPEGKCINKLPVPSGRPTYSTKIACCNGAYGGQVSQTCMGDANPCYSCKFAVDAIDDIYAAFTDQERIAVTVECAHRLDLGDYDNDEECKFHLLLPHLQASCPSPNPSLANCSF